MMRVLLVSQYFPPETGGPPNRALSLARGIRAAGHQVVVVCEKPSHPEGRIWPAYRGRPWSCRVYDGIPVIYVWVFARPAKTLWARVVNHLSFACMAVLAIVCTRTAADVVLSTSPPLFAGAAGRLIASLRRAPHVLDVRDLWPDIAIAIGALRRPLWVGLARRLERWLYTSAAAVTAVTESFCTTIREQLPATAAVHLVRNGSETDLFRERDRDTARERLGVSPSPDHFVAAYVGNVGLAQGLEHLVEAARILRNATADARPDAGRDALAPVGAAIEIVVVGDGPVKPGLQSAARGLRNIRFVSRVAQMQAADWMAAADVLLVSLGDVEMLQQFVPSKLYDALAAGRPVLLGARGESLQLLRRSGGGLAYPPGDARALVAALRRLRDDTELRARLARSGSAFARAHLDRSQQAQRMVDVLESVVPLSSPHSSSPHGNVRRGEVPSTQPQRPAGAPRERSTASTR